MKMLKNKTTMLLAGLAALMLSVPAQADLIDLERDPSDGWTDGSANVTVNGRAVSAGEFKFVDDDDNVLGLFCIDLTRDLLNFATYDRVAAGDSGALTSEQLGRVSALYHSQYGVASNSDFQQALWDIVGGTELSTLDNDLTEFTGTSMYNFFVYDPNIDTVVGQVLIGAARVPEPGTLALLGLGLLGAGAMRRRRS